MSMYQPNQDLDSPVNKRDLQKLVDSNNIAADLDEDELRKIGQLVLDELEIDLADEARLERLDKWEKGQEMAKQTITYKSTPFKNAASVKYPLITHAGIQFAARAYPAIITSGGVVKKKVLGREKKQQEAAAQQPMPNVPNQSMPAPGMPGQPGQGQPPLLPQQPMPPPQQQQRGKSQVAQDAIDYMNYQYTCEMTEWIPDTDRMLLQLAFFGSMYRKTWYSKIKGRPCSKILTPLEFITPSRMSSLEDCPRTSELFTLTQNEIEGQIRAGIFIDFSYRAHATDEDSEQPQQMIEQHRYLDLDEDGYREPYIVTVHREAAIAVSIRANYTLDDVQLGEKKRVAYIPKRNYYTGYTFIPSIDGSSYGTGFYELLSPINDSVNTTINQLLDAGRLANSNTGFISKDLKMKRGEMSAGIGEYKAVNAIGDDLRKGIVPLNFPGANPVLFQLMQFLLASARELANTQDIIANAKSSNMPATTTLALIEQGGKVLNGIYKRIHRSLGQEFKILKRINAEFLNPNQYEEIIDARVSPEDFQDPSLDFEPVSDPEEVSDVQRMAKAQFLMGMISLPTLNPMEVTRRILEAANIPDIDGLLAPPSQPQPDPRVLIEAQKLELEKMKLQMEAMKQSLALQIQKSESDAKILKQKTSAIKDLADAEAAEAGQQLQQYQQQLGALDSERDYELQRINAAQRQQEIDAAAQAARAATAGESGGVRGMEEQPGNQAI